MTEIEIKPVVVPIDQARSTTPRTDAMLWHEAQAGVNLPVVHADYARQLERELAAVTQEREMFEAKRKLLLDAAREAALRAHKAEAELALAAPYAEGLSDIALERGEALQALLDHYLSLVNSGDAGNWDPEAEEVVIAARAALTGPPPAEGHCEHKWISADNERVCGVSICTECRMLARTSDVPFQDSPQEKK
jgi:hypothetical protein